MQDLTRGLAWVQAFRPDAEAVRGVGQLEVWQDTHHAGVSTGLAQQGEHWRRPRLKKHLLSPALAPSSPTLTSCQFSTIICNTIPATLPLSTYLLPPGPVTSVSSMSRSLLDAEGRPLAALDRGGDASSSIPRSVGTAGRGLTSLGFCGITPRQVRRRQRVGVSPRGRADGRVSKNSSDNTNSSISKWEPATPQRLYGSIHRD